MKDKHVRMVIKLGVINEANKKYQIQQEYHKITRSKHTKYSRQNIIIKIDGPHF